MNLGRNGIFWFTDGLDPEQLRQLAFETERLGYSALWYPEVFTYECFALGSYLLSHTKTLIIGSGIANIYARDPMAAKQGQYSLARMSGDRFVLGLGVSHVPLVQDARGHEYRRPVGKMRSYLDAMAAASIQPALDHAPPTVLAALGPKMVALAGERTDGAFPYNTTPEHTASTRSILGPNKQLVVEQKIMLTTDAATARGIARQALAFYMPLANYRAHWLRIGFTEDDLSNGGTDRFLDAMVAWGDEKTIRGRIKAHFDAGATHVCIQPLRADGSSLPDYKAMAALAG
jgi:probable F420-dependent oxidoreductase